MYVMEVFMRENNFIKKIKHFFKRNSYALAVCLCVVLALTLISVTAINYVGKDKTSMDNDDSKVPSVPTVNDEVVLFTKPIENGTITKEYAGDHLLEDNTTGIWQTHQAIDIKASEGTKVLAVYDGKVEKIEHSMMDGLVITISHSKNLKSVYKCLSDEALVSEGDKVKAGQEIGSVGSNLTEKADGAHLHFELYEGDKLVDPTPYFPEEGK